MKMAHPFIKNIKSSSDVEVKVDGAEAVTDVKLDVLVLKKLPVCAKLFRKYDCSSSTPSSR